MSYKIIVHGRPAKFAYVSKDGKPIECLQGIYVTKGDLAELKELIDCANNKAPRKFVRTKQQKSKGVNDA